MAAPIPALTMRMAPNTRFCLSIDTTQASNASAQPSNDMASNRPMEKRPLMRIICMMTSLWPTSAITMRTHATGSNLGFFTLRNITHALAA